MNEIEMEEELRKRYNYLFDNRELILAMCIESRKDPSLVRRHYNSVKRMIRETDDAHTKELLSEINSKNQEMMDEENFYLLSEVKDEIVDCFEEFLLSDKTIEETALYKHVESLKESEYLDAVNYMLDQLKERREKNLHLKNVPAFTVWKILTYVRRKNSNNTTVKEALDKYYNIDRFIMCKHDCEYGFSIPMSEMDDQPTILYPTSIVTSLYNGTGIMSIYRYNEYEAEDDYYNSGEIDDESPSIEFYDSIFANKLKEMSMPSLELKEQILKDKNKSYYTLIKK